MYLGLDLGTSGLKGILLTKDQEVVGVAESNYSVQNRRTGWSEQDPSDWIYACENVMLSLSNQFPSQILELRGIGISGQMHGAVLLEKNGNVIRPCMLWNDTRSYAQAQKMDEGDLFRGISGNIVFPGFTAPKVSWVEENEPENFKKIASILLPKDYLIQYVWPESTIVRNNLNVAIYDLRILLRGSLIDIENHRKEGYCLKL